MAKPRARPKAGNNTNSVRTKKPASISNDLTEARDCPTGAIPGSKCDTGLAGISDHRPEQLSNAGGQRQGKRAPKSHTDGGSQNVRATRLCPDRSQNGEKGQ